MGASCGNGRRADVDCQGGTGVGSQIETLHHGSLGQPEGARIPVHRDAGGIARRLIVGGQEHRVRRVRDVHRLPPGPAGGQHRHAAHGDDVTDPSVGLDGSEERGVTWIGDVEDLQGRSAVVTDEEEVAREGKAPFRNGHVRHGSQGPGVGRVGHVENVETARSADEKGALRDHHRLDPVLEFEAFQEPGGLRVCDVHDLDTFGSAGEVVHRAGHGDAEDLAPGFEPPQDGRFGRVGNVHQFQSSPVTAHVGDGAGDGHAPGPSGQGDAAEESRIFRVPDIDDLQAGAGIGHVEEAVRGGDGQGLTRRNDGGFQGGVGRVRDVEALESREKVRPPHGAPGYNQAREEFGVGARTQGDGVRRIGDVDHGEGSGISQVRRGVRNGHPDRPVVRIEGSQYGGCGRVGDVHGDEPLIAAGQVGGGVRDGHRIGAVVHRDGTQEDRVGRVAHVDDQQAGAGVGHVRQGSGDRDIHCVPRRIGGTEEQRFGGIGDVDDPESPAGVGHVGRGSRYRDAGGPGRVLKPGRQGGVGRVADVDDGETAPVVGHEGRGPGDRHILCGERQEEFACLFRGGGIGEVIDRQPVEIGRAGVIARHGDGTGRLVEQPEIGRAHRGRVELCSRRPG